MSAKIKTKRKKIKPSKSSQTLSKESSFPSTTNLKSTSKPSLLKSSTASNSTASTSTSSSTSSSSSTVSSQSTSYSSSDIGKLSSVSNLSSKSSYTASINSVCDSDSSLSEETCSSFSGNSSDIVPLDPSTLITSTSDVQDEGKTKTSNTSNISKSNTHDSGNLSKSDSSSDNSKTDQIENFPSQIDCLCHDQTVPDECQCMQHFIQDLKCYCNKKREFDKNPSDFDDSLAKAPHIYIESNSVTALEPCKCGSSICACINQSEALLEEPTSQNFWCECTQNCSCPLPHKTPTDDSQTADDSLRTENDVTHTTFNDSSDSYRQFQDNWEFIPKQNDDINEDKNIDCTANRDALYEPVNVVAEICQQCRNELDKQCSVHTRKNELNDSSSESSPDSWNVQCSCKVNCLCTRRKRIDIKSHKENCITLKGGTNCDCTIGCHCGLNYCNCVQIDKQKPKKKDNVIHENEKNTENIDKILEDAIPKTLPVIDTSSGSREAILARKTAMDEYEKQTSEMQRLLKKYQAEENWERQHQYESLLLKYTNLRIELDSQQNNIMKVTKEKFMLLSQLQSIQKFRATLSIGLGTVMCRITSQKEVMDLFIESGRFGALAKLINVAFSQFLANHENGLENLDTEETRALISILGVAINLTKSGEGRLLFLSNSDARNLVIQLLKILPLLPDPKGDTIKRVILIILFNLCINPSGLLSLQHQTAILNEVHKCITTKTDYEKKILGLRFLNLLTSRIFNKLVLRKIEYYTPMDVLNLDVVEEEFLEIRDYAQEIFKNLQTARSHFEVMDKVRNITIKRRQFEDCLFLKFPKTFNYV